MLAWAAAPDIDTCYLLLAADTAAADTAAGQASAAASGQPPASTVPAPAAEPQPADRAAHQGAANKERQPSEDEVAPLRSQQQAMPSTAAAAITSAPSTPHQSLTPTVGYNASQADKDSASAYAVTALADATDDQEGGASAAGAVGQPPLRGGAAPGAGSAAESVDWQRVAEQADTPLPAAASMHPAGSVARLRAIFEQQARCVRQCLSMPCLSGSDNACFLPHPVESRII